LVKGSREVYPIKDYGAIEIGAHQFRHKESGKAECGTFKFAMIWQKDRRLLENFARPQLWPLVVTLFP
jgi:hypothetical protein